jgi:hypothetical protein
MEAEMTVATKKRKVATGQKGRPRMGNECQDQVTFTLPRNLKAAFILEARKEDVEPAKIFRKALKRYAEQTGMDLVIPDKTLDELVESRMLRPAQ